MDTLRLLIVQTSVLVEERYLLARHGEAYAADCRIGDRAAPDASAQLLDGAERLGLEDDLAIVDDRHAPAELGDVLDDVRREDDDGVLPVLR